MSAPPPPQGGYQTYDPQYQQYAGGQAPHGQRPVTPRRPSRRFNPRSPLGKAAVLVITAICASVWYLVKGDCRPGEVRYTETRRTVTLLTLCLSEAR